MCDNNQELLDEVHNINLNLMELNKTLNKLVDVINESYENKRPSNGLIASLATPDELIPEGVTSSMK
jgi:hypothetical protein